MKKVIALTVVSLVLIGLFSVAFAANEVPERLNDKLDQQKARIEEALEKGRITDEEAQKSIDRLEKRAQLALVFASEEVPQWFYDKINWKKEKLEQAVEEGVITSEQAQDCIDRLDDRLKNAEEQGFNPFGNGSGSGRKGAFGSRRGFGRGKGGFGNRAPVQ